MKPGNLVMLSAYGSKRNYNSSLTMDDHVRVGIVVKINANYSYPYVVEWQKSAVGRKTQSHTRRELKYAHNILDKS